MAPTSIAQSSWSSATTNDTSALVMSRPKMIEARSPAHYWAMMHRPISLGRDIVVGVVDKSLERRKGGVVADNW